MTTTLYLDESGDLGFNFTRPRTSQFFVVTGLVCDDPRPVARAVKRVFAGFSKTEVRSHGGKLHAHRELPQTRRRLLGLLAVLDVSVLVVRLDKRRARPTLPQDKHTLYNHVVGSLVDRAIQARLAAPEAEMVIVASRRETSAHLNRLFASHVLSHAGPAPGARLRVEIASPADKGLQAVDCLAWSFFRKYEFGDSSYADMVGGIVAEESQV